TIKFTSTQPYKLVVTGRIKHFISAFGEHVIGEEVEKALQQTMTKFPEAEVVEFTVAPVVSAGQGQSHHEWLIAFSRPPQNLTDFEKELDAQLRQRNTYYDDLISGNILATLRVKVLPANAFQEYMKTSGKLGGQNKVPRLSNDRNIADSLIHLGH
ncbi:MAG: hypothetical protein JWQ14_450, partial [Adhaeribacter sp.]|nr:hypothetical protein [Adhaeribacter sp.]